MFDSNEDDISPIRTIILNDIIGNNTWQKGDVFTYDGFEYIISTSYGDYTDFFPVDSDPKEHDK